MTATRSSLLSRLRDFDDADGWDDFDKLYRPMLAQYARCRGLDEEAAEEIAQECMAAVVHRIQQFKRRRSFRGWLRGMVDHKVHDYNVNRRRHSRADTELLRNTEDASGNPVDIWERQWNVNHMLFLIYNLQANFAEHTLRAFELYVLHNRRVEDICEMLKMTPNQIYVAKSRVTRHIREHFGDLIESLYGVTA